MAMGGADWGDLWNVSTLSPFTKIPGVSEEISHSVGILSLLTAAGLDAYNPRAEGWR